MRKSKLQMDNLKKKNHSQYYASGQDKKHLQS